MAARVKAGVKVAAAVAAAAVAVAAAAVAAAAVAAAAAAAATAGRQLRQKNMLLRHDMNILLRHDMMLNAAVGLRTSPSPLDSRPRSSRKRLRL